MQRAIGANETLAQRDMAGIIAIEIFAQDLIGALADAPAQRSPTLMLFPEIRRIMLMSFGWNRADTIPIWPGAIRPGLHPGTGRRRAAGAEKPHCRACFVCCGGADRGRSRIASRDFATVRRAISMPILAIVPQWCRREDRGRVFGIDQLDVVTDGFRRMGLATMGRCNRGGEKIFSSKLPRLVAMYLLAVTRDTVDSCIWIASATALRLRGRRCATPCVKKPSCWRTIWLRPGEWCGRAD